MTVPDDHIDDAVMEQASAWMFRLQAAPGDQAAREGFEEWLAADPAHERAWTLARRAWSLAGETEPAFAGRWQAAPVAAPVRAGRRKPGRRMALVAVAAAVACVLLAPRVSLWLDTDHATAVAETRDVGLPDGSRVVLGADSALSEHFSDGERGIALLGGEAWFDVAHDAERPFVVTAGDMRVTVTGTSFDVAMTSHTLSVALAEGGVSVERAGQPGRVTRLHPGQRLDIDRKSGATSLVAVDPVVIGAWRGGRLAVQDAGFADVVEALDRHYRGVILIAGGALKARKVTGVYDLDDPGRALRALTGPYGGTVRQVGPWLMVVSAP